MKEYSILLSFVFLLLTSIVTNAQYTGAWGTTWNNPVSASASVMIQGAINRQMLERSIANQQGRRTGSRAAANTSPSVSPGAANARSAAPYAVLRFRPVANTGVPKKIADALGRDPGERAALLGIFQEVKKSYEAEAAKAGKANNIAAALTFFLSATSMAYHQTEAPADSVTDALVEVLQQEMSSAPEFKSMTDLQKQKMHDWLVVAGGFVLAGYLDGVRTSDAKELADYKEVANECFKLVLGTGIEKFNLAEVK